MGKGLVLSPKLRLTRRGGMTPSDIPASEMSALLELYRATDGGNWTNNTNWLTDPVVNNWSGVTVVAGHIDVIGLYHNNLVGVWIGSQFSLLTALNELEVGNNPSLNCSFSLSDIPASMISFCVRDTQSVITGLLSDISANMSIFIIYNTDSVITGPLSDMPASMISFCLQHTDSVITGPLSDIPANMTDFSIYSTDSVITGLLSDIPASMTGFRIDNTDSVITGPLSDIPASMTGFHVDTTNSVITGPLSDIPASMTDFSIYSTDSVITGGEVQCSATGIRLLLMFSCALNQAQIDDILLRLYTDRALFTYAAPELQIHGTNAAPSGVYQYAADPSTGKEYIYALVNDDDAEGFNTWTIVYTA